MKQFQITLDDKTGDPITITEMGSDLLTVLQNLKEAGWQVENVTNVEEVNN